MLKEGRLTPEMCAAIQKILKIEDDMTANDFVAGHTHSRHSRNVRIVDPVQFKKDLLKLEKKYPDAVFFSDPISRNRYLPLVGLVGAIIGILSAIRFFADLLLHGF